MMDEDFAKTLEKALDKELKPPVNGGPIKPGKITLAVEIDHMIEGLHSRIRVLEALKATL